MAFSLAATQRDVVQQIDRLLKILADMPITSQSRYALAEIVLIRAASVFEGAIADLAYKVACGATFPDGSLDKVLVQSRSMSAARACGFKNLSLILEGCSPRTSSNSAAAKSPSRCYSPKWRESSTDLSGAKSLLNGPEI